MKNLTITPRRQRRELLTLLVCFIIACGLNAYAIIDHEASASEMITSLGYVAVFAVVLYFVWTLLRLLLWGIYRLFKHRK